MSHAGAGLGAGHGAAYVCPRSVRGWRRASRAAERARSRAEVKMRRVGADSGAPALVRRGKVAPAGEPLGHLDA